MARPNIRDTTVVLPESLQLSDVQVAEIKKAFNLFDRDADGFIDATDLKPVMATFLQESPSDADLKTILELLDEDQSGVIDVQDFLVCMSKWLNDAARSNPANSKQVLRPEEERQQVHDNIKAFFSRFKKGADMDRIRQLQQSTRERPNFYELMDLDSMAFSGLRRSEISPQQKLETLMFTRSAIVGAGRLVQGLRSEVPAEVLANVKSLSRALSIVEVFETPLERQAFASGIFKLFELIIQSGAITLLVKRLLGLLEPQIQFEALKALTYILPGPRIISVPKTHPFHPSQMLFKVLIAQEGALQAFLALLASPVPEIKEQVVVAVGAFASNDPEPRDMILQSNLVTAILQQVSPIASVSFLRKISWTLSVLCGVTHPLGRLPVWDTIVGSLRALAFLALSDDEEILSNVCAAFSLVLPGVPQQDLLQRLIQLFMHPVFRVRRAALGTIMEIIRYDSQQTNMLLELGLVRFLSDLLKTPDNKLRIDVCELLIVLSLKGFVDDIMRTEAPAVLMTLLGTDDDLRWKIVKVLKYLTRGGAPSIRRLVSFSVVPMLCALLSSFKSYDRVLNSVYLVNQPMFDFDFVRDVLATLQNLVTAGEAEISHGTMNPYAALFDLNCLDQMYTLLKAIAETAPKDKEGHPSWRASSKGGETSIEEKIMDILVKVKKAADFAQNQQVSSMVLEIWAKFFQPLGFSLGHAQARQVTLKIYYQSETRVLEVAPSITFGELDSQLAKKFGRRLSISYKDEEGESIVIDSETVMSRAMAFFMTSAKNGQPVGRLYLLDHPSAGPPSPSSSPVAGSALSSSPVLSSSPLAARHAPVAGSATPASPKLPQRQVAFSSINTVIPIPAKLEEFSLNNFTGGGDDFIRAEKQAVIRLIAQQTSVTKEKLAVMYAEWNRHATPAGLAREFFVSGLKSVAVLDVTVEQAWNLWTEMVKETVDYRDFGCALATIIKGTIDDLTAFIFWQYSEGKGFLTQTDVEKIFRTIYMLGDRSPSEQELRIRMSEMFPTASDRLNEEEWKRGIAAQNTFLMCLLAPQQRPHHVA